MASNMKTPVGRLTQEGVREVRARRERGETYQQIANAVGLTVGSVYNIVKGKTWRWLK